MSRTLPRPQPLPPITSHFCFIPPLPPSPPSPSKWTSYVYHPLAKRTFSTTKMLTCCLKSCSNQLKLHKNVSCHKMLDRDVLRTLSNIQASKRDHFTKIVNDCKLLTIFLKRSILDVLQGSE